MTTYTAIRAVLLIAGSLLATMAFADFRGGGGFSRGGSFSGERSSSAPRSFGGGMGTFSRPSFVPRSSFTGGSEGTWNRAQTNWHPTEMPVLRSTPAFAPARVFQAPMQTQQFIAPMQRQQFVAPMRNVQGSMPVPRTWNEGWRGDRDDRWARTHSEPDWDDVGLVSPFVYGYGYPAYSYGYSNPSYSMGYSSPPVAGYSGPTCTTAYDQGYNDGASGFAQQPVCGGTCSGAYDQGYSEGYYASYGVWPDIQAC